MADRKRLAYTGQPGVAWSESAWIEARRWLQGESLEAAKAFIQREIEANRIVVVD